MGVFSGSQRINLWLRSSAHRDIGIQQHPSSVHTPDLTRLNRENWSCLLSMSVIYKVNDNQIVGTVQNAQLHRIYNHHQVNLCIKGTSCS